MNSIEAYFDNSATTKPCDSCVEYLTKNLQKQYYNPSSLYSKGLDIQKIILECKKYIAQQVQALPDNVIYTSGGTEANNLAILGMQSNINADDIVLMTSIEHPSVAEACCYLKQKGVEVKEIDVNNDGTINYDSLQNMLNDKVKIICIMHVNNEIGVVNNLEKISKLRDQYSPKAAIHVDGVQGFLKVPFSFLNYNVQSYSISGHKIHSIKGIGALVLNKNHKITPIQYGGGQEKGLRPGTENTPGIFALDCAIKSYLELDSPNEKMRNLKIYLYKNLKNKLPEIQYIGVNPEDENNSSPNILSVSLYPLRSDVAINALSNKGVYFSSGSACASNKQKLNTSIKKLGISRDISESVIRFSLSPYNDKSEIDYAILNIVDVYSKFAKYTRR